MIAAFSGKLAAVVFLGCEVGRRSAPQAIWSIRVPCPGGRGASTVGWGALASSAPPSGFSTGALGALASEMLTGAGAVTLETLIETSSGSCFPDYGRAEANAS
jgi:hypothetical protein